MHREIEREEREWITKLKKRGEKEAIMKRETKNKLG